jgi:hypothetical protein
MLVTVMKRSLLLCALEVVALIGCDRQGGTVSQLIPSPNGRYQAVVLDCRKEASEGSTQLKVIRTGEPTKCETPSLQEATLSSGAQPRVAWTTDTTLVVDERKEPPSPRLSQQGEVSLVFSPWRAEVSSPVSRDKAASHGGDPEAQSPASGSRGTASQWVRRGDARVKSDTQELEPPQSAEEAAKEAAEEAADAAAGEAADEALDAALRKGLLRRANLGDKKQWLAEMARVAPSRGLPPDAEQMSSLDANSSGTLEGAYVVLRPMKFPDGLYGAHSAVFFVPKGTERPRGDPGHSAVYDFNDMSCTGASCR